ncbi:MAG: hypothetical protein HC799_14945 [Limnothrix sp. RL_2_0]|nr:hypothetical protein [Limnothrix sp. RL_2_0]
MAKDNPNRLLVEGAEDLRTIPELVEANGLNWGTKKEPLVFIENMDGYENIANANEISTQFKSSNLQALGIIVDADEDLNQRWQSLRDACLPSVPNLPETIPDTGLIHTISRKPHDIRFGVWIMPDNQQRGMLETFLAYLIPEEGDRLWDYAQKATHEAKKSFGATYKDSHTDKANLYTWLAWQEPPGRQLHDAIKQKILAPNHPKSQDFMNWFRELYQCHS